MRAVLLILGLLLAGPSQARSDRCRFLEQIVLMEYGLAKGQACRAQYLACLSRPFVRDDAMPKTRCIETIRCGTRFWTPIPRGVSDVSNLEIFKQDCEPE